MDRPGHTMCRSWMGVTIGGRGMTIGGRGVTIGGRAWACRTMVGGERIGRTMMGGQGGTREGNG